MIWGRGQQALLVKGQTVGILGFVNHAASVTSTRQHPRLQQWKAGRRSIQEWEGLCSSNRHNWHKGHCLPSQLGDGGKRQPCPQEALPSLRDRDWQAKGFDTPAPQHSQASRQWGGGAQLCPKQLILVRGNSGRNSGKTGDQQKGKTKQNGEEKWRARKKKCITDERDARDTIQCHRQH